MTDLIVGVSLLGTFIVFVVLFVIRVSVAAFEKDQRAEREGSSVLLGQGAIQMFYWVLSPTVRALVSLGITPNQITSIALFFGLLSGVAAAYGLLSTAATLIVASASFDILDGQVARATKVSSDAGEVYDAAADRYSEFSIFAGLAIYVRELPIGLLISLCALQASMMVTHSTAKAEALQVKPPRGAMRRAERILYLAVGLVFTSIVDWFLGLAVAPTPKALGPIGFVVTMIAVVGNVSAIRRMWAVGRLVADRQRHHETPKSEEISLTDGAHPPQESTT